MPTPKNMFLYALAVALVAFVISRIPGVTLDLLAQDRDKNEPISLGTNVWPGYEPFYLAKKVGILDKTIVNLLDFSSPMQVNQSFVNGTIDAAAMTLEEVLVLRAAGVDVVVPLVIDFSYGGDAIVARSGIQSLEDLTGKVIATPDTSLGALMLSRALAIHGVERSSVTVVYANLDEQEALYAQGAIDAAVTFSPVLDRLKALGMHEVFSSREIPDEVVDVLAVKPHIVEQHGDTLGALVVGWFAAVDYLESEPEKAAALMSPRLSIPPNSVHESLAGLRFVDLSSNLDYLSGGSPRLQRSAESLEQIMISSGYLDGPVEMTGLFTDKALIAASGGGTD